MAEKWKELLAAEHHTFTLTDSQFTSPVKPLAKWLRLDINTALQEVYQRFRRYKGNGETDKAANGKPARKGLWPSARKLRSIVCNLAADKFDLLYLLRDALERHWCCEFWLLKLGKRQLDIEAQEAWANWLHHACP